MKMATAGCGAAKAASPASPSACRANVGQAVTDAQGRFSLPNLPNGSYTVNVIPRRGMRPCRNKR
jgi:hypothetical protein